MAPGVIGGAGSGRGGQHRGGAEPRPRPGRPRARHRDVGPADRRAAGRHAPGGGPPGLGRRARPARAARCPTAPPIRQLDAWRSGVPSVASLDARLPTAVDQALADLAALRIVDEAHPDRAVVAAGAPWFMTLFGRDSLLTSWMTLPFDASLAGGVLASLADLQGTRGRPGVGGAAGADHPRAAPARRRRSVRVAESLLRHRRRHPALRGARRRGVALARPRRRRSAAASPRLSVGPSTGPSARGTATGTASSTT